MKYASVAFPIPQELTFTYAVPARFQSKVECGTRVIAPLGPRAVREGVIVALMDEPDLPDSIEIKEFTDLLDDAPTYSAEQLDLTKWMAEYYLSSWGEALQCAVPDVVRTKQTRTVRLLATEEQIEEMKKRAPVQAEILATLRAEGNLSPNQIARRIGGGASRVRPALAALEEKELIELKSEVTPRAKPQTTSVVSLAKPIDEIEAEIPSVAKRAPKQAKILQLLIGESETSPAYATDLTERTDTGLATLRSLEKKGLIRLASVPVVRNPLTLEPVPPTQPLRPNAEQADVLKTICAAIDRDEQTVFLLHGVTGSGKTEVYMQAIDTVLKQGKGAIVLIPEIALTPQTVSRFVGRFGECVAVLHSQLSDGERYDQWHRIRNGDADIVVGPRSAIFAPLSNLGIIVVDEEHETSYKQNEPAPRYHAREVAVKRAELANCQVILGTATPSLESFYRAQSGAYQLLNLPSRVGDISMPSVQIVDMREELKQDNRSIFSTALRAGIEARLTKQEQIILFLNRRGFSTYVFCRTCGYVERCNNCSISLTFHLKTKLMVCHHCGDERPTSKACPQCGSAYIRHFGLGTEQVEQEVIKAFPDAKVQRMDTDSMTRKDAHQNALDAFKAGTFDILLGTQMIAKGLDFPNVTLVGVISADTALNLPDFRAGERAFNLLTQVAGRSGRSEAGGDVIIQTYTPEHYSIQAAEGHDYHRFYQQEVGYRNELLYPPFSHAATILLRSEDEAEVIQASNALLNCLESLQADQFSEVEIRGPVAAPLSKIMGKFRWHFLLRSESVAKLRELIREALANAPPEVTATRIDLVVDIDPISVL
jgi:primosomal protein N' (replication factor Y)